MGVAGAALATLISRMVEFAIMLFHIWKNRIFRLQPRLALAPGRETVKKFIRYGGPVVCNETLFGLGTSLYPTIMGHMEGSREILAAYTIAGNVEKLFTVVAFGLGGTAAILVGREIGAGRSDRVRPVGMALSTLALGCGCVLSVILFLLVTFVAPHRCLPPVPALRGGHRGGHHDAHCHDRHDCPAHLQLHQHCGRAPGRRRRKGRHPH